MALGTMSSEEVISCSDDLKNSGEKLSVLFEDLSKQMNNLGSALDSQGAEMLIKTYRELEVKIKGFPAKVKQFETFLREAAGQYVEDDKALESEIV